MKKSLAFTLLLFTIAAQAIYAQTNPAENELTELLHNFLDGVTEAQMHDRFWADDLIYTSSSGTRFGKKEIMAGFADSETEEPENQPATTYSAEDIKIQVYNDMAIVAFRLIGKTKTDQGIQVEHYLNSGTFVRRNGQWKVVNWHATKVPDK